ncbi:vesicle coat component [Massospora cicadina]|nr:vesicle coat component [Massospora cicadina]
MGKEKDHKSESSQDGLIEVAEMKREPEIPTSPSPMAEEEINTFDKVSADSKPRVVQQEPGFEIKGSEPANGLELAGSNTSNSSVNLFAIPPSSQDAETFKGGGSSHKPPNAKPDVAGSLAGDNLDPGSNSLGGDNNPQLEINFSCNEEIKDGNTSSNEITITDKFAAVSSEIDEWFESLGAQSSEPPSGFEGKGSPGSTEFSPIELDLGSISSDFPRATGSGADKLELTKGSDHLLGGSSADGIRHAVEERDDLDATDMPAPSLPAASGTTDSAYAQVADDSSKPLQNSEPRPEAINDTVGLQSEVFGEDDTSFSRASDASSLEEATHNQGGEIEQINFAFFDQTSGTEDASVSFFDSLGDVGTSPFQSHMPTLANLPYTTGQTLYAGYTQDDADTPQPTEANYLGLPFGDGRRDAPGSRASGYVAYEEQRNLFSFSALPSQRSVVEAEPPSHGGLPELTSQPQLEFASTPRDEHQAGDQAFQHRQGSTVYQEESADQYSYPTGYQNGYPFGQAGYHTPYPTAGQGDSQAEYQETYPTHYQEAYPYPTGYSHPYQEAYPPEYPGDYPNEYQFDYSPQYASGYHDDPTGHSDGYQTGYQGEYPGENPLAYQDLQPTVHPSLTSDYLGGPSGYPSHAGYQAQPTHQEVQTQYQANQYLTEQQGYHLLPHGLNQTEENLQFHGLNQPEENLQFHGLDQPEENPAAYGIEPQPTEHSILGPPSDPSREGAPQLSVTQEGSSLDPQGVCRANAHHPTHDSTVVYDAVDQDLTLTQRDHPQESIALSHPKLEPLDLESSLQSPPKLGSVPTFESVAQLEGAHWDPMGDVTGLQASAFQSIGLDDLIPAAEVAAQAASVPLPASPEKLCEEQHGRPPCGLFHLGFGGQTVAMMPKVVMRFGAEGAGSAKVYPSNVTLLNLGSVADAYGGPLSASNKESEKLAIEFLQAFARRCPGEGASVLASLLELLLRRGGRWEGANDTICDLLRPGLATPPSLPSPPPATTPSNLVPQLYQLLLLGKRQEAARLAGSQRAWGHALIIASCAGKELWQETVQAFTRQEVAQCDGLALAYGLFAGLGRHAVNDVVGRGNWREKLAFIFANRTPGDGAAICALGDELVAGDVSAAHACYLLSSGAAIHGPPDAVGVRLVLVGAPLTANLARADDALRLTECYELALAKSGNPGMNFLQAYKLHRAWQLAGTGRLEEALNYCRDISAIVTPHPPTAPHYHHALRTALDGLVERIKHANGFKPADATWTRVRPTLGSLMNAMEGRINQLVMGDEAPAPASQPTLELQPGPTVFRDNSPHQLGTFNDGLYRSMSNDPLGPHPRSILGSPPAGRRSASPHLMSSPFGHARHPSSPFGLQPNASPEGLFSPLAPPSVPTLPTSSPQTREPTAGVNDEFGFGNAPPKPKSPPVSAVEPAKGQPPSGAQAKATGGLLGGLWSTLFGGKSGDPKTVYKAQLGEANSFYYDPTERRWINKAAGDVAPPPPQAPPPRAHSTPANAPPGSPRSPGPPSGASTPAPGPGRARRGTRGRYVDIFSRGYRPMADLYTKPPNSSTR